MHAFLVDIILSPLINTNNVNPCFLTPCMLPKTIHLRGQQLLLIFYHGRHHTYNLMYFPIECNDNLSPRKFHIPHILEGTIVVIGFCLPLCFLWHEQNRGLNHWHIINSHNCWKRKFVGGTNGAMSINMGIKSNESKKKKKEKENTTTKPQSQAHWIESKEGDK